MGFIVNPPRVAASSGVDFLVDPTFDNAGRETLTATLHLASQDAYFYVDDAYWASQDSQTRSSIDLNINSLANEFDTVIYPKMHEIYGSEWSPGIDNDSKIYILLTDIRKDAGGYFNPNDEYYKNQVKNSRSNEKEILYLNINSLNKTVIKSFLAHELQHMINWYQKKKVYAVDEEVWLNEAMSEYAATALGYDNNYSGSNLETRVKAFLKNPNDSLTEWNNLNEDYASVDLFMQFLVDHYGIGILKLIITSPQTGISAINDALQKLNSRDSFRDVFTNWVIANYLNNQTFLSGKYAYFNRNLNYDTFHIMPTGLFTVYPNITVEGIEYDKDWAGKWYQFVSSPSLSSSEQTLKINFASPDADANFIVPYIIKKNEGTMDIGYFSLDSGQKGAIYLNSFGREINSVTIMPVSVKKTSGFTEAEMPTKFSYKVRLISINQPILKSVSPNVSAAEGGVLVTLTGENFEQNPTVSFGGINATEVNTIDPRTIVAKIPPFSPGTVDVSVTNPNSQPVVLENAFTYFSSIKNGSLIRAQGDYKVYVVNGRYKRWIQAAEIFKFYPNFSWSNITIITPAQRDYYEESFLVRAEGDYKVYEINGDKTKHHLQMTAEQFSASGRKWDMVYVINKKERDFYKTGVAVMFR